MTSTVQKKKVDDLIKMMSLKGVGAPTSQDTKENTVRIVEKKDVDEIKITTSDSEGSSQFGFLEDSEY